MLFLTTDRTLTHATLRRGDKVKYDSSRKAAITYARRNGNATEYAVAKQLLDMPALPFAGLDLTGEGQGRITKLGGHPAIVRYGGFTCTVTDDGSGLLLTKTTGRFCDASPTSLDYLGSFYVAGDKPKPYGKVGPESDQVGLAHRTAPATWRLEFPAPY